MSEERSPEVQLQLFPMELMWQELPQDVRHQVTQLFCILCIEIVEQPEPSKEPNDE